MKISQATIGLCILLSMLFIPAPIHAVNSEGHFEETEIEDERKIEAASLIAYISAVSGIASLFIIPTLSFLLFPAAFILGLVTILNRKRRLNRRSKALALIATIIGGAFVGLVVISFTLFLLLGI